MEIVLMCQHESGSAAFNAEWIEGHHAPQRRYTIINHRVTLDGYADAILHHDADELLANPLYRMPTPAEQDQMAKAEQGRHEIQEAEQGETLPIDTEDMPVAKQDLQFVYNGLTETRAYTGFDVNGNAVSGALEVPVTPPAKRKYTKKAN